MTTATIPNLAELLKLDEKIISTKIQPLTAPGENYGSLMLSVEVTTQSNKKLRFVAKTLPPSPAMQEMFNCPVTFPKEISFYKSILPSLRSFQKKHGVDKVIDFTPEYFGSRVNLHRKDDKIDQDAVLLLENLKLRGFINFERTEGFDLESAELVVTLLAQLHGLGIALKLQEPKVFQKEIKSHLISFTASEEFIDELKKKYLKIINSVPQLEPYLDRLKKVSTDIYPGPPCREPFATISHNDFWVNNIMIRLENGKPVETKIVDFQISDYSSPAKDLIFFLFSSVQNDVLRQHCDSLIRYYHKKLIKVLSEMECDTEPFCFEEFQKELDFEAKNTQFAQIVLMLRAIFAPKGTVTDLANLKPSDLGNHEPTNLQKEKLVLVVEEFAKRNWI